MSINPLLDTWQEVYGHDAPECWHDRHMNVKSFTVRTAMTKQYSFAVPNKAALDLIASCGPVVEIGAGTGYWAKMLRLHGCDVVAYDVMLEAWSKWFPNGLVDEVLEGGIDKAAEHASRTLLLVWPYMDSTAYDTVMAYAKAGGQRVIYVGESHGGCTADEDFFMLMGGTCYTREWDDYTREWDDEHDCSGHPKPAWQEVKSVSIPQWDGINDYLTVYEPLARP